MWKKDDILKGGTCYSNEQIESLSFINNKTISVQDILRSEIPAKDKYWWFCKKLFTTEQNQRISIMVAECIIDLYEKKYPGDDIPRKAIEAAKEYLANPNKVTANAAYAAANAAYAAYAAAYAAANAANAAYAAGSTRNYKDLIEMILIDFIHSEGL